MCWGTLSSSLLCIICTSVVFLTQKDPLTPSKTALLSSAVQLPFSASSPVCRGQISSPKLGGRLCGDTVLQRKYAREKLKKMLRVKMHTSIK